MPEVATAAIALCWRCRRDVLPQLAKPSWHREKHRATAAEREPAPSPEAERIKARKERKSKLRNELRRNGIIATAKLFLEIKGVPPVEAPDEDCDACRQEQLRGSRITPAA